MKLTTVSVAFSLFLIQLEYDADFFTEEVDKKVYWKEWAKELGLRGHIVLRTWECVSSVRPELNEFVDFVDDNGYSVIRLKTLGSIEYFIWQKEMPNPWGFKRE